MFGTVAAFRWLPLFFLLLAGPLCVSAQTVLRVAVASNFRPVLEKLVADFERQQKGITVTLSSASTGILYNQIVNGAPFDLFLAADADRPETLEEQGRIVPGSRRVYAYGRLVLWDNRRTSTDRLTLEKLSQWRGRIAIANPDTAPYGVAAKQTLEQLGLWHNKRLQRVQGVNVQQAWQFVSSGNVSLGLVAMSQFSQEQMQQIEPVDERLYQPIRQEMVIPISTRNKRQAVSLADFILSPQAQSQISASGYHSAVWQP